ncbi:hypothetical protein M8J75_002397 [Diaphorina citri]|nr:hypothetical protein M8J75_002397 [Diaphorina citri]KAI5740006.1 hypothetical protein M8J77_026082 [Diaphorina citri]
MDQSNRRSHMFKLDMTDGAQHVYCSNSFTRETSFTPLVISCDASNHTSNPKRYPSPDLTPPAKRLNSASTEHQSNQMTPDTNLPSSLSHSPFHISSSLFFFHAVGSAPYIFTANQNDF